MEASQGVVVVLLEGVRLRADLLLQGVRARLAAVRLVADLRHQVVLRQEVEVRSGEGAHKKVSIIRL